MKTPIQTYIVDSFTDEVFKGNPAGVCLLESELSNHQMQSIAIELGLSETAFVLNREQQINDIRFFSPKMEIPLCGHATLAAAKVLFTENSELDKVTFNNIEKLSLIVTRKGKAISMRFPAYTTHPIEHPKKLIKALGVSDILYCAFNSETKIILIEIRSCEELRKLSPNYHELIESNSEINGVLVTAQSNNPEHDFESRYFWPWSGTLEDPVTGGTHTFLAPYWAKKLGCTELKSFQCSKRSGKLNVRIEDQSNLIIEGEAAIFLKGNCWVESV